MNDIIMLVRAQIRSVALVNQVLMDYERKWDKVSQGSIFESINSSNIKDLKLKLLPLH